MMDLANDKEIESRSTDRRSHSSITRSSPDSDSDAARSCDHCCATKTPLWRAGPSGPKSLCNACGIRYQKSRRAAMGIKVGGQGQQMKKRGKMGMLVGLSKMRAVMLSRKQGKQLGEEEEAAVLLMALSSGLLCNSNH